MSLNAVIDVAVGILQRQDGAFLLAQRPDGKPYSGWWEFPGGKLEANETALQALARELHEELGITLVTATPWVTLTHSYTHATVRLHFCRVSQWLSEPQGREGQALQWVQLAPISPTEHQAARYAHQQTLAELARQPMLSETDRARLGAASPEQALGLRLEPAVGPLLPASLPPLKWMMLPDSYAITNISRTSPSCFFDRLDEAFEAGIRLIQFREPDWPQGSDDPNLLRVLQQLVERAHAHGAKVLVNSIHPRSWSAIADGVHVRATDLSLHRSREEWIAPGQWLGASSHSLLELTQAQSLGADFAVLGSVLPTDSHPGNPGMGWAKFEQLCQQVSLPVYALGGQGEATRGEAAKHGAHGIAAIRAFW